jgi:hypothetical protein
MGVLIQRESSSASPYDVASRREWADGIATLSISDRKLDAAVLRDRCHDDPRESLGPGACDMAGQPSRAWLRSEAAREGQNQANGLQSRESSEP